MRLIHPLAHRSLDSLFLGVTRPISHQMSHRVADVVFVVDRFCIAHDETHCTLVACESR